MTRLLYLAVLAIILQSTKAAIPAPAPYIVTVPKVSPVNTFNQIDNGVQNDVHAITRLPSDVTPSHYYITITPYFDTDDKNAFTFDGKVSITIKTETDDIQQIILHSEDLTYDSITVTEKDTENNILRERHLEVSNSFLLLDLNIAMIKEQEYVITAVYSGHIQDNMRGFYRSWYYEDDELRWVGATHFQPSHARKVFPSFDEPKFKAVFVLAIDCPEGYSDVLSNMPIASEEERENGMKRQIFQPTPLMSTYLVAFVISHYKSEHITEDDDRPFAIHARASVAQDGKYAFDMGQKILLAMEEITQYPYYAMADYMKMDHVAIPDHSDGAMENYGLLAYREPLILSREGTTSDYHKQRIIGMISHETAHMWFGNLVTCEWWDNLWLNEGFARYYEMFLAHKVSPEMDFDVRFVTEHMFNALYSDSFNGVQSLTAIPQSASITSNDYDPHSSVIIYSKGASILRQTEHLLGEQTFEAGLSTYLEDRAFKTVSPEQLWEHLQKATSEEENILTEYGITVSEYFNTWSSQSGFPLLTVEISCNTIKISQSKFNPNEENVDLWIIPITYTTESEPDFVDTKPSYIMKESSLTITKSNSDDEWVILNKQATGFYRVNYDAASWDRILQVLRGPKREKIHQINRAQIINDVFALAMYNLMTYDRALELISWLEYETEFAPWAAAIDSLDYLRQRVQPVEEILHALDEHVVKLASTLIEKIGFQDRDDDDFTVKFTRLTVVPYLCRAGHADCIEIAITKFATFKENSVNEIPPNLRPWVYCTALGHGSFDDFDFLWNRFLQEDVSNEKQVILEALGCTRRQDAILGLLDHITSFTLDPEGLIHAVRTQDALTVFNAVLSSNIQNAVYAFTWFKKHWQDLATRLETPSYVFHYFGRNLFVKDVVDEYIEWVNANTDELGNYETAAFYSTLNARGNMDWINVPERINALIRFFDLDMEYVTTEEPKTTDDDETPKVSDTTPSTTFTTPGDDTTPDSGSAQAIAAGLISVFVGLLFQMMLLY